MLQTFCPSAAAPASQARTTSARSVVDDVAAVWPAMEDAISHSSLDSAADEFVVVNAEPRLKIANNGDVNDLKSKLNEVLHDDTTTSPPGGSSGDKMSEKVSGPPVTQECSSTPPTSGGGDESVKETSQEFPETDGTKTGKSFTYHLSGHLSGIRHCSDL